MGWGFGEVVKLNLNKWEGTGNIGGGGPKPSVNNEFIKVLLIEEGIQKMIFYEKPFISISYG